MKKNPSEKIHEYEVTRDEYLRNADEFLREGKLRKASEFLWGAIALQIKRVALIKYKEYLGTHKQITTFVKKLAESLKDEELIITYRFLEKLHTNFYDEEIEPDEFEIHRKEAYKFMKKLEDVAKQR
ncbi:hypothetical protein DRP04_14240 [Archaeoglobales archaeon]|nr:MAG: hypothetical protein DRP04_14240 [Archaeoglobales archaeon]